MKSSASLFLIWLSFLSVALLAAPAAASPVETFSVASPSPIPASFGSGASGWFWFLPSGDGGTLLATLVLLLVIAAFVFYFTDKY